MCSDCVLIVYARTHTHQTNSVISRPKVQIVSLVDEELAASRMTGKFWNFVTRHKDWNKTVWRHACRSLEVEAVRLASNQLKTRFEAVNNDESFYDTLVVTTLDSPDALTVAHFRDVLFDQWITSTVIDCYIGLLCCEVTSKKMSVSVAITQFFDKVLEPKKAVTPARLSRGKAKDRLMTRSTEALREEDYDYKKVKGWFKKLNPYGDGVKYIVIPVNACNSHWMLVYADFVTHTVTLIDSLGGEDGKWARVLKRCLEDFWKESNKKGRVMPKWKTAVYKAGESFQKDSINCGVYVMTFIECFLLHDVKKFNDIANTGDISYFRSRIIMNIVMGRICQMN